MGSRQHRRGITSSTTCAPWSTSTRSARANIRSSATTWTDRGSLEGIEWHALVVDGHDIPLLLALDEARATKGRPTMILARTLKGKGLSAIEGKDGWHGKALKKGEETDNAVAELREADGAGTAKPEIPARARQAVRSRR